MAVTDGWTERTVFPAGSGRRQARSAPRSLGAALRDAGLADAAPDPREDEDETGESRHGSASSHHAASPLADYRSPRLAVFAEPESDAAEVVTPAVVAPVVVAPLQHESVVSPPPWLRAARRGRWQARMTNTFGWVMTLVVAGSIIGLAGHYLAVPPLDVAATLQARQ